ncbi:MAG: amidase [Neisseriaceae bacterium]|nr:amidase [Neisseriaceae bacterium]
MSAPDRTVVPSIHPPTEPARRRALKTIVGSVAAASLLSRTAAAATPANPAAVSAYPSLSLSHATQIVELPAWQLSALIHTKQVSCVEVMEAYLAQIERVNPSVNAIVALHSRRACLLQARQKDHALARGQDQGWLHGFPQAVKDLEATQGIPTTLGSPLYRDWVPKHDSLMVQRIKQAGAIIIGKTNTPEFGFGSHTYNPIYGATGNPYDPNKSAGGSSGGAACALAMRMQAVADGSDFMGSLRNPAGWCNVYGFRPSWGRVPATGEELFINEFGTQGPMARSVPDLALLLATQSGHTPSVPASLPDEPRLKGLNPANAHARLQANQAGKRIAWLADWDGYLPMSPDVLPVCQAALTTLGSLGLSVESIAAPMDGETLWRDCWLPHRHFAASGLKAFYDDPKKQALLKPEAQFEYAGSLNYSGADLYAASVLRSQWYGIVQKLFEQFDYLVVPTAQCYPFAKTERWPQSIAGKAMDTYHRWMEVVTPWTLCGSPVVALPAGFNQQGLPMGIQVIGKPRHDFELLQLAYAYEQAQPLVANHPPPLALRP